MTEVALSRDVENPTIDENQNIVKMSDISSNTVVDFSNPAIREQLLNISYEQSQYASEQVKSSVPDYESGLFTRIAEGFKGAGKQLIKLPEQAQIIGGEALISIGGIAGFEKTEKLGKSIVQSAVKDLDFKNRFIYDTSIKTSDKDKESFSYMLGSGLEQFGEAILASYINPKLGAFWVGAKEVGSEIEEGVQVYREKTGDLNLDKIDKSFATKEIVGATTLGIVNGFIERIGGAPKQISIVKQPLRKTSLNILKGIAYEGGTEFLQSLTNIGIDLADGTIDVSMLGDAMKQALMEGAVGGIIGGANTTIASIGNKRIAKKMIMDEFKNTVPTKDLNNFADAVYESADYSMKKIVANEFVVSEELRNKHGDIFNSFLNESLKAMKESGGYEGVSEADLAQYATETAKQFADDVLSEANKRKVFIEDVINSKDIIYKDGELRLASKTENNANQETLFQELPEGAYDEQGMADINTPEFKKWFGDSKVVDENGKPLVVYHSTDADFDIFDKSKQKRGFYGQGFYFSNDEETTRHYGQNTIPVYLSIKKPLDGVSSKELRNNLEKYKQQGYDGTIHRYNDGTITYSVFEPNQIKSVYNRGTFSLESDNIYEQVGGLPKQKKTRKGMFDVSKKTIKLFENADFSTLPHELAHFWLDNMWTYANSGNASQSYLNQFQAVKDFLGMTTSYPTRQQHEKFATAYEKYIFKGELPTTAIKSSFDDYERWLRNIYNNISDIKQSGVKNVKLTPDIVKFFDSMLNGGVDVASANKQILEEKAKEDTKKYDEEITPKAVEFIKEEQRVLNENIEKSPELKSKLMMPNQTGDKTGYLTAYKKMIGEDVEAGSIILKDNYEKAVDYVNKNPVEADKIVKGEMDSPTGIEKNLIYLAYGEQQKAIGNTENRAIAAMNQALELRAAGQKIASQRLAYNESIFESYTNPTYWIETVQNNKAEQLAKKAKMTTLELEQKIESAIKSGMKQNKTAEEISKELSNDLGLELYQTDYGVDETYETKLSGYKEIYKYVNERIGKTLSLEEAQQITKMSDDLYSSLENLKDENGNPSVLYFKKLSELEAYANSLSPSSAYKILTEFMAPANLVASVKTPFVNIVSNIFGGSLEAINRRAKYGITSSIVSKQKESAFKQYSKDVFEATGYNVSTMSGDSFEKSILGEKIAHLEGKTDKFTNELRRVGKIYETIVFKYGLGKFDQISKDFAFVDSVSLQATKLSNGNVEKANAIFDDAILIEPKTGTGKSVRQQAITDALIAVYQNNGVLSDFSIAVRNNMNKVIPGLGRFYIPFAKTPGNVIGLGLETFLPAKQIYNTIVQSVKNKKPTINTNDRGPIARSVTAYAISAILGFGLLDDDDYMPPYVLASQTDRNLARELNIPFNSIRVGETWYSLDFAGPFSSILSGFLQAKRSESMSGGILNFLVSGTMQGLSIPAVGGVSSIAEQGENIIQKVKQKKDGKIIKEAGIDLIDSVYSRIVPAIFSDIANAIDFYDRDADGFEKLARKIPLLRNTLNEKINLTSGKAEEFGIVLSLFDVFAGSRVKAQIVNNVANELFRLNNAGYGVNLATPTRSGDLSKLDDDTKYMALKDFAELYSEKVDRLISRDSYLRKSDEDKKEMINKVRSDVLRRVKFKYRKQIKTSQF